jgi:excisionase family DNA binding protein
MTTTTTAISTPLLSVSEACSYLNIRKSFLYVLIGNGELPARKLGARTFILRSDADDLIGRLPQTPVQARVRAEKGRNASSSSTRAEK